VADAVARAGAGRVVGDTTGNASLPGPFALAAATPDALSAILGTGTGTGTYAEAARSLAAKIAELPPPSASAPLFESLVAG
jgi:hypothetical protein